MSEKSDTFFEKHHTKIYIIASSLCLTLAIWGYFLTNDIIAEVNSHAPRITADGSTLSMVFMAGLIPLFVILEVLYRFKILRASNEISLIVIFLLMVSPHLLMRDLFYERIQIWMLTNGYERCEDTAPPSDGAERNSTSRTALWAQHGACEKHDPAQP